MDNAINADAFLIYLLTVYHAFLCAEMPLKSYDHWRRQREHNEEIPDQTRKEV